MQERIVILSWYRTIPFEFRVYLGVKTCEVFSLFSGYYFPWLHCVDFAVASLYSLYYVTREFRRFLHRG